MENSSISIISDASTENMMTIHSFMRDSYTEAKKQFRDGVSFIKYGVNNIYENAGNCLQSMALPVNNYLKDLSQIEAELRQEELKTSCRSYNNNIIPIEIALLSPMEENY